MIKISFQNNKFATLLLIIFIVFIGVAGFFVYPSNTDNENYLKSKKESENQALREQNCLSRAASLDYDFSDTYDWDWYIFRNENPNFCFRHPRDTAIEEYIEGKYVGEGYMHLDFTYDEILKKRYYLDWITGPGWENINNLTYEISIYNIGDKEPDVFINDYYQSQGKKFATQYYEGMGDISPDDNDGLTDEGLARVTVTTEEQGYAYFTEEKDDSGFRTVYDGTYYLAFYRDSTIVEFAVSGQYTKSMDPFFIVDDGFFGGYLTQSFVWL